MVAPNKVLFLYANLRCIKAHVNESLDQMMGTLITGQGRHGEVQLTQIDFEVRVEDIILRLVDSPEQARREYEELLERCLHSLGYGKGIAYFAVQKIHWQADAS